MNWLIREVARIDEEGPNHHFAMLGTMNWMRALRVYCSDDLCSYDNMKRKYQNDRPSNSINLDIEVKAFTNLSLCIHNLCALQEMQNYENKSLIVRSAIVTWYYCIYNASKAMIVATTGTDCDTHSKGMKMLQANLVLADKLMEPFSFNIINLNPSEIRTQIDFLKAGNTYDTNDYAANIVQAKGVVLSYLNGTAKREAKIASDAVKKTREFRELGVTTFRSNAAKALRDRNLNGKCVNFLTESFRFRGKANYRDAIYLTYNTNFYNDERIDAFIEDLYIVANTYTKMAMEYTRRKVRRDSWRRFLDDFEENNILNFDYSSFLNT